MFGAPLRLRLFLLCPPTNYDYMKTLAVDSSSLISLSESCVVSVFRHLLGRARFVAPESVYQESVDTPSRIKQHGFSALRIKRLFFEGAVGKVAADLQRTREILQLANSTMLVDGKPLELIQIGEAECLALVLSGKADALIIDEKTLRLLIENPEKLMGILKTEYEGKVVLEEKSLQKWQQLTRGIKIIRSAELLAVAGKNGYFGFFGDDEVLALRAAVFALKGYGCSLTKDELKEYDKLVVGR